MVGQLTCISISGRTKISPLKREDVQMCHVHMGIQVATTYIWVQTEITSTSYNVIAAGSENMPCAPKGTSRYLEMILKSISYV